MVKDLDSMIEFYCQKLGLKQAFEFINNKGKRYGVYIHTGERTFIEIVYLHKAGSFTPEIDPTQTPEKEELPDLEAHGLYDHLCLEVDDIKSMVERLREKGVEVSHPKMGFDNSWQAWLSDPSGNRIELMQYTEKSWQQRALQAASRKNDVCDI